MWSEETLKIASPSKAKGTSSCESGKKGLMKEAASWQKTENILSELYWEREEPGKVLAAWRRQGKHQIWNQNNQVLILSFGKLSPLQNGESKEENFKASYKRLRHNSIQLEKAPSYTNSQKGLPPEQRPLHLHLRVERSLPLVHLNYHILKKPRRTVHFKVSLG